MLEYGRASLLKMVGDEPSGWCGEDPPVAYTYVQRVYWDNGFLRYKMTRLAVF